MGRKSKEILVNQSVSDWILVDQMNFGGSKWILVDQNGFWSGSESGLKWIGEDIVGKTLVSWIFDIYNLYSAQVWAAVVEETDNFDFDGLPYKREKGGGKWTANSKILPKETRNSQVEKTP